MWKCIFFSLIIGILIGICIMLFNTRKIYKNKNFQYESKNKTELNQLYKKLINHFNYNATLLDNIAKDCRQLCRYMEKQSDNVLSSELLKNNASDYCTTETEADNDQSPLGIHSKNNKNNE